ncbi:HAD family hydrolase [Halogeometricum borinquense]|uniref:HAD family hydrolase n=1 Tax=Halogeometricum borinquense TaxID=60847 RepID=A0A6C0UIN6_9EURY|nr:HAD family hydrolase [Halogeometricum borinquense]QIQ75942.1 HAD family hydrolase [Halogeometricum borinquense]
METLLQVAVSLESMTEPPVEAVLFDLDDTLVRYRRSPGSLLGEAFEACGTDHLFPVEAYYDLFGEFADRTSSMAELRRECFAAICESRGYDPETGRQVADAFAEARDHRNVEFLPGAERVLRTFAGRYRLGVVTNGPQDAQAQKIDASGVGEYVETVVYAGHETAAKPAPDAFTLALDRLDVAPEDAVHVGNSVESDVAGANAAGVGSVWVPDSSGDVKPIPDDAPGPDYRIESVSALLPPPW